MPQPGKVAPVLGAEGIGKLTCQFGHLAEMILQRLPRAAIGGGVGEVHQKFLNQLIDQRLHKGWDNGRGTF
jgi:hypothetical protein